MPGALGAAARPGIGERWIDWVSAALSLTVFAADLTLPNGASVIVLLLLVILLSSRSSSAKRVAVWTLVCCGLNFASYVLRHGFAVVPAFLIRRILYDVIFGTSMLLALRHQRLERQRRVLAELLDLAGSVVFRVDLSGTIASWSRGAAQLYGWPEQDAVGRSVADVLGAPADAHEARLALALSAEFGWEGERRYVNRVGTEVWVYCHLVAQRDHAGRMLAVLESHTDLTDIRRTALLTERAEAHYRHLFDMTPAVIMEQDHSANEALSAVLRQHAAGDMRHYLHEHAELAMRALQNVRLIDCNHAAVALFQSSSKAELLAMATMESTLLTMDSFIVQLSAFAEGLPYCETEAAVRTLRGETRYVLMATTFPTDADRGHVLVSMMDITEGKLAQNALLNAQDELTRVTRMATLGELTSLIAQEIEHPLAAIVTASQDCLALLQAPMLDAPGINLLAKQVIKEAGTSANSVSRVRQFLRKSSDRYESFDFKISIQAAIALIEHEFTAHGVYVSFDCPDDLPRIAGDRAALEHVIVHLLLTGIRASEHISWDKRNLKISVTREAQRIFMFVRDHGERAAGDDRGYRLDRRLHAMVGDRAAEVGLSMCRANVEAFGGQLTILPADQAGTIVQVELPINGEMQKV